MKSEVKTAYAYLRVGTCQQNESGVSIQTQKEKVKNYCRQNNIRLIDVFIDCPASANNFNRGGFIRMLGRNVIKPVDYIVSVGLDRISRNTVEYLNLRNQLSKLGTEFRVSNGSATTLFEEILKEVAEFESVIYRKKHHCCANG